MDEFDLSKDEVDLYEHDHMIDNECVYFTRMFQYPVRREVFHSWHENDSWVDVGSVPFVGY